MTRRELVGPAEDVESQGRDCNISDGFSERSSTLPAYQDVVGDTPTLAPEDSKSNSDGKNPGRDDISSSTPVVPDAETYRQVQEPCNVTSIGEYGNGSTVQQDEPKQRRASLRRKLFWILAIVVLYNVLARLLFSSPGLGKPTPPPSEPEADDTFWPSPREIRVHESFHAVHGTYPLYDLLDISTVTGAVQITVEPKSGNKTAVVRIKSKTGAIHVRFAKSASSNDGSEKCIFERVYQTQMDSTTGAIHADVLHGGAGGETVLRTKTGLLDLRVTPIGDQASRIETTTVTGLNRATIEVPMHGTTLKNLTAVHRSKSTGMIDVHYPQEWEGRVHAYCKGSGQVDVQGEGLNRQGGGTDVYAWRGEDAARNGRIVEVVSEGTGLVRFKA